MITLTTQTVVDSLAIYAIVHMAGWVASKLLLWLKVVLLSNERRAILYLHAKRHPKVAFNECQIGDCILIEGESYQD